MKSTLDKGLEGGVLSWRIPGDPERYSDLNKTFMRVSFRVTRKDGTVLTDEDKPFLDPQGIHALFSSCEVAFNGFSVSMMRQYPFTTALARSLATTKAVRDDCWDYLDGSWLANL